MPGSEIDLQPFEFESEGTTAQVQAALAEKGKRQKVKPGKLDVHRLPDVFTRPDTGGRPPLAMLREWIVERIRTDDPAVALDRAVIFTDLWIEYAEAQDSIDRRGVICLHPRTSVIIENPYVARRDKTRQALAQIRDVRADWLWHPSNTDPMRAWLAAAVAQRDADLASANMTAREKQALAGMEGQPSA